MKQGFAVFLLMVLAVLLLCLTGCRDASRQGERINVAAASGLQFAVLELVEAFGQLHPCTEITITFGSSGNLYHKIVNGAPFDVYLAADIGYAYQLAQSDRVRAGIPFAYALGRQVIWVRDRSGLDAAGRGFDVLTDERVRRIAIANPEHAPYGRAAVDALQYLGLLETLEPKLVFGENIGHAAQFVESGAADVGLIAFALALSVRMQGRGNFHEIPLHMFGPINQGGVLLIPPAGVKEGAEAFKAFLLSEPGQAILLRHGFYPPEAVFDVTLQ